MHSEDITVLQSFNIHPQTGFLPTPPPLLQLPAYFEAWEQLAHNLTPALQMGSFRELVIALPVLDADVLSGDDQWERAYLLLSCFGQAWHWQTEEPNTILPPQLAIPWSKVADRLERPAVITHSSIVLNNWRKINPEGPLEVENLACLMQFGGSQDEAWFYLITTHMEAQGSTSLCKLVALKRLLAAGEKEQAASLLTHLKTEVDALTASFSRVRERCDPYVFYHRVRPYLASLTKVTFTGTDRLMRSYHGGSAAQSSLIQSLDAAMGVERSGGEARYLNEMRRYMPAQHRAFVEWLEADRGAIETMKSDLGLSLLREHVLTALRNFRQAHMAVVHDYIMLQAKVSAGPGATGTGGTSPMRFLEAVKEGTR